MIIDFNKMATAQWPQFQGGEKEVIVRKYEDTKNRIMVMKLEPGASIGYHLHENGGEVIYVLQGVGVANYDGVEEVLEPGMCGYCPEGHSHGIENRGEEDLVFFSVVHLG